MVRRQHDSVRELTGPGSAFLHTGSSSFGLADARSIERSFVATGRRLREDLLRLVAGLESGSLSVQGFVNGARSSIKLHYYTAYSLGAISVFPFYTVTDRDIRILDDELNEETGFLKQFASDLSSGRLDLDPVRRAGLYLLALRGIFERGRLEAMPPGPYRWRLGITEHCLSCIQASLEGPYQRDQFAGLGLPVIPGTPGDGSVCDGLTRCGCRYELESGVPVPNQDLAERLRGQLLEVAYGASSVAQGA